MKEIFEAGREPARDIDQPSPMRRKILRACAYLPAAPLLAMLGGCDESSPETFLQIKSAATSSDTSTAMPIAQPTLDLKLPPFNAADEKISELLDKLKEADRQKAELEQKLKKTTEVTHIPNKLPPAAKPKKVGIYSLQYNSFTQISTRKLVPLGTCGSAEVPNPAYKRGGLAAVPDGISIFQGKSPKAPDAPDVQGGLSGIDNAAACLDTSPLVKQEPVPVPEFIAYENIETYLKRALDNRFALLYRAMVTAFEKRSPKEFDVSFFTAPEFYWNVPFSDFIKGDELHAAADLCQKTVTKNARTLIAKFPASQYGTIVLLPGTIATLKQTKEAVKADGTPVGEITYLASNHLTCTHNLPLDDPKYPRPAYMIWPKRMVSSIDFGYCGIGTPLLPNPAHSEPNRFVSCALTSGGRNIPINIGHVSSSRAQSFDTNGKLLSNRFNNKIVEDLPFGVDICLDYSSASVQSDPVRISQLDEQNFKLDFLISAGMPLQIVNYNKTPFIQYAIHNEGYKGKTGLTEVWKLNWTKGTGNNLGTMGKTDVLPIDFPDQNQNPDSQNAKKRDKSAILVDRKATFVAPKGADAKDIPDILDEMNAGIVRIWSLDGQAFRRAGRWHGVAG
jgi:hypothetical protein